MKFLLICFCIWACASAALPPSSSDEHDEDDVRINLRRNGKNVCSYMETRPVEVNVSTTEQTLTKKIVRVKSSWSWKTEKRTIYKIVTRTVYHTVTKLRDVRVFYCCSGWTNAENSNECNIPICDIPCMNAGSCLKPNQCACPPGFDGQYCQNDINECELEGPKLCEQLCENVPGNFRCYCMDGYNLNSTDQKTCTDVDECSLPNTCRCSDSSSSCKASCLNIPGSYECICSEGYALGHDEVCRDVNECIEDVCEHKCINTPGSYRCSCHLGFELNVTSGECYDVDECKINNGGCNHTCHNVFGGSVCSCNDGFYLDDDRKTCKAFEPSVKSVLVCTDEDHFELISCGWPKSIKVLHAFYGRLSAAHCVSSGKKSTSIENCTAPSATQVISSVCDQSSQCFIDTFVTDRMKDPCPGTNKYMQVFYQCII